MSAKRRVFSECCSAVVYLTLGDGVLLGHCGTCNANVCRVNPRTGQNEWLDGASPWTARDDLRPMGPPPGTPWS